MYRPLYQHIASTLQARANCIAKGNTNWQLKHEATLNQLADLLPSGAGIDSGSALDWTKSTADKLVIDAPFHHMDGESGMYAGWTSHTVTVRASLMSGISISISGRNRNYIKEYLHETFDCALRAEYEHTTDGFVRKETV